MNKSDKIVIAHINKDNIKSDIEITMTDDKKYKIMIKKKDGGELIRDKMQTVYILMKYLDSLLDEKENA